MGLKQFPHFNTERALVKALRDQGFDVGERTATGALRVANSTGNAVHIHPGSIVGRSGPRSRKDLHALSALGFVPPAEHARAVQRLKAEAKEPEPPAGPQVAPVEGDRAYACELCAVARCPKCAKKDLPCAFRYPWNRGRHHSAQHPEAPRPASVAKPRGPASRSGRVRTRTDPGVIKDPFRRLARQLRTRASALVQVAEELEALADATQSELDELRRFRKKVEEEAGRLYDVTTAPRTKR